MREKSRPELAALDGATPSRSNLLHRLADALPACVAYIDSNERYAFANSTYESWFGISRDQVVGEHPRKVMGPQAYGAVEGYVKRALGGERLDYETKIPRQEGGIRHTHVSLVPDLAEGGSVSGCFVLVTDVTQSKQIQWGLKRALAEKDVLVDATRAVLRGETFEATARSLFESAKRITGATAGYVALLSERGFENEVLFLDAGGRDCIVDPDLPMPIRGLRGEAYRTGEPSWENDFPASEWMAYMPEGHARLDNVLFAPLNVDGQAVGVIGLANKPGGFTEDDARVTGAIGELAAVSLVNIRTREQLRESEKMASLGSLVAAMAHEMRPPLLGLMAALDAFEARLAGRDELKEIGQCFRDGLDQLSDLTRDLLEYGRPYEPQLSSRPLRPVICAATESCRLLARQREIELRMDVPSGLPRVRLDGPRLEQVFRNAIDNAVRHSPERGLVEIEAREAERAGERQIVCRIRDSGPGFIEEDLPKVFEPFYTQRQGGSGLGLAIAWRIVREHEGTIAAGNAPDGGALVTLSFPVCPEPGPSPSS